MRPLRRVQLIELDILRELGRRCEAESLRWYIIGGTLLGAARHRGFIPWDDDIDVGMPRPDYERFEALCRRSPDPRFVWQSYRTDRAYPYLYGKLLRADTRVVDPAVDQLPIRQAVHIDVFPLDGAPASALGRRGHGLVLKLAATTIGARIRRAGSRRYAAYAFRAVPRAWAMWLVDRLAGRFGYDSSPYVVNAGGAWGYGRECQPRSRFEPSTTLEFEGIEVPVPGAWHEYLTRVYGDYQRLPPPEQQEPRHGLTVIGNEDSRAPTPTAVPRMSGSRVRRAALARLGVLAVRAAYLLGRLRPPSPCVVLASRDAARIGGNLLAIRLELERRSPSIPVRVVGYRMRSGLVGRMVSTWEACRVGYHLAASRLFVADDWLFPIYAVWPRRGTTRVQVWHATGAFKRFGFSMLSTSSGADEEMLRQVPMTCNYDLCLVSSRAATLPYADAFRLPPDRFTSALGLPRTDALFDAEHLARVTESIRRRYALLPDRKLLLYAPTFRDTVHDARYHDALDLGSMRDALAGEWQLLLRLHPHVRRAVRLTPDLAGFVVDVSDWPDLNELMLVADLLLTDYSSAIFEFALLDRPMAFFAPDLAAYQAERGFYLDYPADLPGPAFETSGDVAAYVKAGRFDVSRTGAFARTWFDVVDGHASERFVDRIVLPALRGEPLLIEPEPRSEDRVLAPLAIAAGPGQGARGPESQGRVIEPEASTPPGDPLSPGDRDA